ncbi:YbaB/EbfC family DNA-binding protein [Gordonia sp. CPCC 205333]|uniref:YbaB/EbfC family DNA-binding protein n=1 Tax=Gordonia sp. CPCC 205333 TaxID=3140790 RepID=UPI003AF381A3
MDELEARAHRQLEALHSVQESIGAVRTVEESDDSRVWVEVDGAGGLVGLRISPTASQLGGAGLARVIVETATIAARRALAERAVITTDFVEQFADLVSCPTTQSDRRN